MTPKIIHQIVGPNPSGLVKKSLATWKELHKYGFEIMIWNDDSLVKFIESNYNFALKAFLEARNHAEASDIARYLLVHQFGGYYVDWDILLFDVEGFINLSNYNFTGYLLIDTKNATLASEHFSAPANEEYLIYLVRDIVSVFLKGERDNMATPQYSGPFRMRDAYKKFRITNQYILDVKNVFEYDYSEIRNAKIYGKEQLMIHFWGHSWIDQKFEIDIKHYND